MIIQRTIINEYLFRLLDNRIGHEDFLELKKWLAEDPSAMDYYFTFMNDYVELTKHNSELNEGLNETIGMPDASLAPSFWQEMAMHERTAVPLEREDTDPSLEKHQLQTGVRERKKQLRMQARRPISRLSLVVSIGSLAGLFLMIAYVLLNPSQIQQPTATIIESFSARWQGDKGMDVKSGQRLFNTDSPLRLRAGLARIRMDNGAEVLIQGPAEFQAEAPDQLYLMFGKLSATVPPGAEGFVVRTPKATVVDYGTEFGLLVDPYGRTEAHVFAGEVELRSGSDPVRHGGAMRLLDGFAGTVNIDRAFDGGPRAAQTELFVRDVSQIKPAMLSGHRLDLADMLGGGNGLGSGTLGRGIDPQTGKAISGITLTSRQVSDYTPVANNPFVDGVFMPNGEHGPVDISTTGQAFGGFRSTYGRYWHEPVNGGVHYFPFADRSGYMLMSGLEYGTNSRPALLMHANLGLTFDLRRIAQAFPGQKITEFTALCGIPDGIRTETHSIVDFVVLLDGRPVFRRDRYLPGTAPARMRVPIGPHHRFLTLAVTDGGNQNHEDWALFAEPFLILAGD